MKLVIKGLVCDVSYEGIIKEGGFHGFDFYLESKEELESRCTFMTLIEQTQDYDLFKLFNVKEEKVIKELRTYYTKPSVGDYLGFNGKEYKITKVTCWEDGAVVCVIDYNINENLIGESLEEVKSRLIKESVSEEEYKCCDTEHEIERPTLSKRLLNIFNKK